MKNNNLTYRAFMCIGLEEHEDAVGEWINHFRIGESYAEIKEDCDGNIYIPSRMLLLMGDHNIEMYVDESQFAFLIDTSAAIKKLYK